AERGAFLTHPFGRLPFLHVVLDRARRPIRSRGRRRRGFATRQESDDCGRYHDLPIARSAHTILLIVSGNISSMSSDDLIWVLPSSGSLKKTPVCTWSVLASQWGHVPTSMNGAQYTGCRTFLPLASLGCT